MKTAVRESVSAMVISTVIGGVVAVALTVGGLTPSTITSRVFSAQGQAELMASHEQAQLTLALLAWMIVVGLLVHAAYRLLVLLRHMARCTKKLLVMTRRRTLVSTTMFVITGLLSALKLTGERTSTIDAPELPVRDESSDRIIGFRSDATGSSRLMPAISSAGLAIGLTTHVRRQRATALKSAPNHAALGRLSQSSSAAGIALFERAKATDELAAFTNGTSDTGTRDVPTAMVIPLGVDRDRLITVTLRPGDLLSVDADSMEAASVLRHLLNTVILAPWLDQPTVILHGFPAEYAIVDGVLRLAETPEEVFRYVDNSRCTAPGKLVVVITRQYVPEFDCLPDLGVMVVSTWAETNRAVTRVVRESGGWRVSTTGESFRPYGVTVDELSTLRTMTKEMSTVEVDDRKSSMIHPSWRTLVRVLGPVEVMSHQHSEIVFRKSKSVELLCWLAFHRDRPTVAGARTALWEVDVRDATFHNVLSELRRGLTSVGLTDAVGRATKHRLYLDERIVTDGDLLRTALTATEGLPPGRSIEELCGVLRLVRGLPFSATEYAWADAEGITSTLYWLVTRSIDRVAELVGDDGNGQALLDATAAGLRMAPGDERLLQLRDRVLVRS